MITPILTDNYYLAGLTIFTVHVLVELFPEQSEALTSQIMISSTPPESLIVIVSPSIETMHDSVLFIRFPFLVNIKQSYPVISIDGLSSQLSEAVAVNEIGASGDVIIEGASHEMTGGVVSSTVTVCSHVLAFPHASVAVQVFAIT